MASKYGFNSQIFRKNMPFGKLEKLLFIVSSFSYILVLIFLTLYFYNCAAVKGNKL